jgi:thioredoxin-dependent peroxiredoxin
MATLHLGDQVPNFEADTTAGHINFYDWLGNSWGLLFSLLLTSHPCALLF